MRSSMFILTLATVATLIPSISSAADVVRKFNIATNCKAEVTGGSVTGETLESCISAEQQAKDQLTQQWERFSSADKTMCLRGTSSDGTPSYVELQTCLEMSADAKARLGDRK